LYAILTGCASVRGSASAPKAADAAHAAAAQADINVLILVPFCAG
jgi:hypothetical protein